MCKVEIEECITSLVKTLSSFLTMADLKRILELLQKVEIKPSMRTFPEVTQKGIDAIRTFHEHVCTNCSCDCDYYIDHFSKKLAKMDQKKLEA